MSIRPKYRLTEKTHHNDRIYDEGEFLEFDGVPEYYMEPANAPARDAKRAAGNRQKVHSDPVSSLPISPSRDQQEIDPLS